LEIFKKHLDIGKTDGYKRLMRTGKTVGMMYRFGMGLQLPPPPIFLDFSITYNVFAYPDGAVVPGVLSYLERKIK